MGIARRRKNWMPFIHSVCSRSQVRQRRVGLLQRRRWRGRPCAPPGRPRRSGRRGLALALRRSTADAGDPTVPQVQAGGAGAELEAARRAARGSARQGVSQASCVGPFSSRSTCAPGRAWSIQICTPITPVVRVLACRGLIATSERTATSQKYLRNSAERRSACTNSHQEHARTAGSGAPGCWSAASAADCPTNTRSWRGSSHVAPDDQLHRVGHVAQAGGEARQHVDRRRVDARQAGARGGDQVAGDAVRIARRRGCAAWCPAGGGRRRGRSAGRARPAGRAARRCRCRARRCCAPCPRWCGTLRRR